MPTVLADPPTGAGAQQSPPAQPAPAPVAPQAAAAPQRACPSCGSALAPGQDWCLHCGSAAPGSLGGHGPGWRAAAVVLGALALLIGAAAAAGSVALNKSPRHRVAVALQPRSPLASPAPVTPVPGTLPTTPGAKIGPPTTIRPTVPLKPPKIPLSSAAPKIKIPLANTPATPATPSVPAPRSTPTTPAAKTPTTSKGTGSPSSTSIEVGSEAIVLDTNAASTYNPYSYPAGNFGDPARAIDGDTSTGWSAAVEASVAPRMAEGLVIDLKSAQRVSALELVTSTPGMSVQVYGASTGTMPASISDPAWKRLSALTVARKHRERIRLTSVTQPHRFVLLWISRAPDSATRVTVNELELFPPAG